MSDTSLPNLCNLETAFSNTPAIWTNPWGGNTYQLLLNTWTASAYADNKTDIDYYFVNELHGLFNHQPAYTHDNSQDRGYYARVCIIKASIEGGEFDASLPPILIASNPDTNENATEVTSGVNYSLGGQVGSSGGDVSSGMDISRSNTITMPDVTIANQSDAPSAVYQVYFQFADPSWEGPHGADSSVGKPPLAAITTFQPWCYWIWKIPKKGIITPAGGAAPGLGFRIDLSVMYKRRSVTATHRKEAATSLLPTSWSGLKVPLPPDPNPGS